MLILGLLGMYFDAAVVFFMISSLLFRMAMAVLCMVSKYLGTKTFFRAKPTKGGQVTQ